MSDKATLSDTSFTFRKLWQDMLEAVSGTEKDFTQTKLNRAIFLLSVPMVLEMIMESVFAVVDIYFVSKLGADAVATVGITESALTVVYAIGSGLSAATTAVVARRVGEKHNKQAGVAAFQAILAAFTVSLIVSVPGVLFAPEFLKIMGASEKLVNSGYHYPMIMFGGNAIIMLLFIINAVFRSSGDAAISMRVLWIANIINLVLDPLLIFGIGPFPELGIKGAAIATNIGRGLAVIYQLYLLFNGKRRIRLSLGSIRFRPRIMANLLKISAGGIMQHIIETSSWIILVRIIAEFGPDAIAGYTIAIRIVIFALLPSWGLSNAAATLVGQNLGAEQPTMAEKAVWITGKINMILLGLIGFVFVLFPDFFIKIFIDDASVVGNGIKSLRLISYGFAFYALGMVVIQGFNGSGNTGIPTKINFLCFWMIEIPLAWVLAIVMNLELTGVCLAILFSEILLTTISVLVFRTGHWKLKKV